MDLADLSASPLVQQGGWCLLEAWPAPGERDQLLEEARALRGEAERTESTAPDPEPHRGGDPPRGFASVPAGERQEALYQDPALAERLGREVGRPVQPSAERGTYSFYEQRGDHLGIHRDIADCDVTLVTCLQDHADPGFETGAVAVWPARLDAPLSEVRLAADREAVRLRLGVGETLLLCGAVLPHAVLPVAEDQDLILSILCFAFGDA